jgi:O-antigen/teichoic acid export membrane protein
MMAIQLFLRIYKQWYSKVKYDECKIRFRQYVDKKLMKSILSFTGWNLFGSIGAMAVTQVKGVLLNMFFGVKLNTADGISYQASSQVNTVSVSLTRAINPQLMKSEGSGDRYRMLRITEISTKYSSFLFALFAIPVFLETPYLLKLWLKTVPEYATIFCQLSLLAMMIEKFTFPITDAIRASGNIRNFQVTETVILLLNIPLAYAAFKYGFSPEAIYIVIILVCLLIFLNRLHFGKKIVGMSIPRYMKNAIVPILSPIIIATILGYGAGLYLPQSFWRLCFVFIVFMSSLSITFWKWGLLKEEKERFKNILIQLFRKIKISTQNQVV